MSSWKPLLMRKVSSFSSMSTRSSIESNPRTVAELFLQTLAEADVDYIFAVLGSDHPSLTEAYLRRQQEGKLWPKMLHFQHEFVAISAADGYGRITGKTQCVLVHVDVGTAALGQGLHNASVGRAPVLIFAGLAPYAVKGVAGCRSEHVQWFQDVPNQAAIVAPYVRHSNEIKVAEHVRSLVKRALLMAQTGSQGPTYLTAAREVLATPIASSIYKAAPETPSTYRIGGLPADAVELIGAALMSAHSPLVITGYLGRNHNAVQRLVDLSNLVLGLQVFDSENRYMSFPASHPAWLSRSTGATEAIREADLILVLDCDVPWIPSKTEPNTSRIYHVDIDPRKENIQQFDIGGKATFLAECDLALSQLVDFAVRYKQSIHPSIQAQMREKWTCLEHAHETRLDSLKARAQPNWSGAISIDFLAATLRSVLPVDTIFVHDVVTNTTPLLEQLQLDAPGTCLGKGGSGLGWAGGSAIGVKLAKDKTGLAGLVCSLTGDGAFIFGVPTATYWAQKRLDTPFLSIVLNNGGWKATRIGIKDVHPGGVAAAASDADLGIDLMDDGPDYLGVAVAASDGNLWAAKLTRVDDVEDAVRKAVQVVQEEKRGALLEVVIT